MAAFISIAIGTAVSAVAGVTVYYFGKNYPYMEAEKKTWIEHNIMFDKQVRAENIRILENIEDGSTIYLGNMDCEWGKIKYSHWFVTDGTYFIEFGSANRDIYTARVTINTQSVGQQWKREMEGTMNSTVRDRIRHVLGMSNYSLCLRNCEHVANYIFRGKWVSHQMDSEPIKLIGHFRSHMLGYQIRLVNTFPSCIRPHVFNNTETRKMYSFINDHYVASRFDYFLDCEEDTFNILVIGPTGAGKSHLINVFFNQPLCDSEVSHRSVTREIYFIRGNGVVYSVEDCAYMQKNIVVADTIGLCDTEWNDEKIIELIKGRVSSNFKKIDAVYIVFRADRLLKEHIKNIKKILEWLQYHKRNNYLRFQFVGTNADYLSEETKNKLRLEATEMFNLKRTDKYLINKKFDIQSLIYTGFPPEDSLNDSSMARVLNSWENLKYLLIETGMTERINIDNSRCTIF